MNSKCTWLLCGLVLSSSFNVASAKQQISASLLRKLDTTTPPVNPDLYDAQFELNGASVYLRADDAMSPINTFWLQEVDIGHLATRWPRHRSP